MVEDVEKVSWIACWLLLTGQTELYLINTSNVTIQEVERKKAEIFQL